MSTTPAEMLSVLSQDGKANTISNLWQVWDTQRDRMRAEWVEQRNYVFATDTSSTTQGENGWKNSTTLPKLTQIRDNLHSNYKSALFPNDEWLKWESYTADGAVQKKANNIEAYMLNKVRTGSFRKIISKLLYDYIDYGNAFCTVKYENRVNMIAGEEVIDYVGPTLVRISPLDIVFNASVSEFTNAPKIVRQIVTIGELKNMVEQEPDNEDLQLSFEDTKQVRKLARTFTREDWAKADAYTVDGFGNLQEYYQSGYVELLHFYGDWHNVESGEIKHNQIITIADRSRILKEVDNPSWLGHAPIYHVGWRERPDNLWSMGPLANLVGMQYRIDHLENSKADAYDIAIHPPLKIRGEVEDFTWGPGEEVHVDEGGDVEEIVRNIQWVLQSDNGIDRLEARMEQFAGAPREAMGIRSPGEKTAFEVQELQNAAGRIFQEKIEAFEIEIVEKALNAMLEVSRRNLDTNDVVRVMDDDLGVAEFVTITRDDITASGKLRPIGARHFAAQALLLQNLTQLFNSQLGAMVQPHVSGKSLSKLVEDVLGLERRALFAPNAAIFEQQETQRLATQAQEDLDVEQGLDVEGGGEV